VHVVGVVADRGLKPSHDGSGLPVRFAADVDASQTLVTVKYLAAVSSESGLLETLAGILEHRLVGEDPYDASTRVREGVRWIRAARHDVSLGCGD
jgi:hypothetical protein